MNALLKKNQVYHQLRTNIISGALAPGEQLPGEVALAAKLGVSRITLRTALEMLAEEQLIDRVERKGNFVANKRHGKNFLAIGLQSNNMSSPFNYILPGIEKTLGASGHRLTLCSKEFFRAIRPHEAREMMARNNVDGIFLLENNFRGDEPEIAALGELDLPLVLPHAEANDSRYFCAPILSSDIGSAFAAGVRYLAEMGHRRIGTIGLKFGEENTAYFRNRSAAEYLDLLRSCGAVTDPGLLTNAPLERDAIRMAVRELLTARPSAIMCFSDFFALHVYEELAAMRISIPQDMSVMGFCGYPGGQFMNPPLSTVDLEYEKIGSTAAEVMLSDERNREKTTVNVPFSLKLRASIKPYKD